MFIEAEATKKTFDPGGVGLCLRRICFYKHAIPPGLKAGSQENYLNFSYA